MKRLDFFVFPFVMDFATAMAQIMVNLRALDLGASATMVGVVIGLCWGLAYMLTALTTGTMVSRYGARTMMLVGGLIFGVGTAACGFAHAPWLLLVAAPLAGAGSGFFWPSLQTYLKVEDPDETRIRSGIFNVSWTCGILSGVGLSGHAYRVIGPQWSFWGIGALAALVALVIAIEVRSQRPARGSLEAVADPEVPPEVGKAFLLMAWVTNFAMWLVGSSAVTILPRLARGLSFSDGAIGEMVAVVWLGQVVLFGVLATGSWWHYRKSPLIIGLLAAAFSMALFGQGRTATVLVIAAALLGASRAPSHMGSIHYGLNAWGNRDANMGYHEAIIGAGSVVGPVLSGMAADTWGIRAPFVLGAGVLAAALAIICLWPVRRVRQVQ